MRPASQARLVVGPRISRSSSASRSIASCVMPLALKRAATVPSGRLSARPGLRQGRGGSLRAARMFRASLPLGTGPYPKPSGLNTHPFAQQRTVVRHGTAASGRNGPGLCALR
jgi:hypothetical protein